MATKPIPNQIEKKVITCDVFKCTYFLPGLGVIYLGILSTEIHYIGLSKKKAPLLCHVNYEFTQYLKNFVNSIH